MDILLDIASPENVELEHIQAYNMCIAIMNVYSETYLGQILKIANKTLVEVKFHIRQRTRTRIAINEIRFNSVLQIYFAVCVLI